MSEKPAPFGLRWWGLGDVGGTVLTGLTLLEDGISEIGIYDPNEAQCARYEMELNQVLPMDEGKLLPRIIIRNPVHLFDCDALLFTGLSGRARPGFRRRGRTPGPI